MTQKPEPPAPPNFVRVRHKTIVDVREGDVWRLDGKLFRVEKAGLLHDSAHGLGNAGLTFELFPLEA